MGIVGGTVNDTYNFTIEVGGAGTAVGSTWTIRLKVGRNGGAQTVFDLNGDAAGTDATFNWGNTSGGMYVGFESSDANSNEGVIDNFRLYGIFPPLRGTTILIK
jgi:hypothetical protein